MGRRQRNKQGPPAALDGSPKRQQKNGAKNKKTDKRKRDQTDSDLAATKKQKVVQKKKQVVEESEEESGPEFLAELEGDANDGGDDLWDNVEPATDDEDEELLDDEFDLEKEDAADIFPKADTNFLGSESEQEEEEEEEDDEDMSDDDDHLAEVNNIV